MKVTTRNWNVQIEESWEGLQRSRHRSTVQIIRRESRKPERCANLPCIKNEKHKSQSFRTDVRYASTSIGAVKHSKHIEEDVTYLTLRYGTLEIDITKMPGRCYGCVAIACSSHDLDVVLTG
jgi:hypothetical protein